MAPVIKRVTPFTQTVKTVFSRARDMFTPNWDEKAGAEQSMTRAAKRSAMGQKLTPIGKGTLTKKG